MLISRNAIYSALFLVLNFATVAMLYLILGAPFIALSQITVYAGSIMVLFLFVIMLLGAERLPHGENPALAAAGRDPAGTDPGWLILPISLFRWAGQLDALPTPPANFGAPKAIGELLFTQYHAAV